MPKNTKSSQRTSLLRKNILVSFLIKGWSAVVVFLMVPVTLHCLGDYKNGVWLTISSLLLWIDNMDIGLGNGLRNKLAAHLAHEETREARSLVSSTFAMLTCIIIPVFRQEKYRFIGSRCSVATVIADRVCAVASTLTKSMISRFLPYFIRLNTSAIPMMITTLTMSRILTS